MLKFFSLVFFLSVSASPANGVSCFVCSSQTSSACGDPFDSSNISFIQLSGYNYCQKNVFANGLVTRSGGSACSTSGVRGITTVYCCSNRDLCNVSSKAPLLSFIVMSAIGVLVLAAARFG